jgi:formylglycine-generating enzyme required for sulfatase activity
VEEIQQPEPAEPAVEEIKRAMTAEAAQVEFRLGQASFVVVRIPAGEFDMGSPPTEEGHRANESPVRRVRISKPYYLGRYEVTQLQYKEVMGDNPSTIKGDYLPVFELSYSKALRFCEELSRRVGLPITLPTEAQWEYACRAGTKTRYHSGDTTADLDRVGWYRENSGLTVHPVGQKEPNAWGLYDMHGNVCELCSDFLPDYDKNGFCGGVRGGAWMLPAEYCRSADRMVSDNRFKGLGIRIAISWEDR